MAAHERVRTGLPRLSADRSTDVTASSGHPHPTDALEPFEQVEQHEQLDPAALIRLAQELESEELARSIAGTYLRMLDARLARADSALARRDEVAAMDVLLSLRVSSATVGLVGLEAAVLHVIDAVHRGEPDLACERGGSMLGLADRARCALRSHLERPGLSSIS
ncbi:hypothetical protein [Terrabacter sp. BE26]|uniref:hypothetical protein n=1 Tax=Terrabacter sp. BE26 TaxID=2898152 RepID=UPI0035BE5E29